MFGLSMYEISVAMDGIIILGLFWVYGHIWSTSRVLGGGIDRLAADLERAKDEINDYVNEIRYEVQAIKTVFEPSDYYPREKTEREKAREQKAAKEGLARLKSAVRKMIETEEDMDLKAELQKSLASMESKEDEST
jgi:hypothetical protein